MAWERGYSSIVWYDTVIEEHRDLLFQKTVCIDQPLLSSQTSISPQLVNPIHDVEAMAYLRHPHLSKMGLFQIQEHLAIVD